jgi:serine/threonine-protein kinase RsbT
VTAVSELTRNVLVHAKKGEIIIEEIEKTYRKGLKITVIDEGPGIPDINLAMTDGFSSINGLGKGLSGTKKLMDEFSIQSEVGKGTEVFIVKWVN